jgi:hypothetical protein
MLVNQAEPVGADLATPQDGLLNNWLALGISIHRRCCNFVSRDESEHT